MAAELGDDVRPGQLRCAPCAGKRRRRARPSSDRVTVNARYRHHGRAAEPVLPRLLRPAAAAPPAPDAPAPVAGPGDQGPRRLQHAVLARRRPLRHLLRRRRAGAGGLRQHQPRGPPRHPGGLRLATKRPTPCSSSAPEERRRAILDVHCRLPGRRRPWTRRCTTSPTGAPRNGPAAPTPPATTWAACTATARTSCAPVGPIYWSSSDLAAEGYQHVDGAVRMGRATAARILADAAATGGPQLAGCRPDGRARGRAPVT